MSPCRPVSVARGRRRAGQAAVALWLAAWLPPAGAGAASALPQRDLLVELRERAAVPPAPRTGAAAWDVRSADARMARERPAQQLRVANGAAASLRLTLTRPLQAWQVLPGAVLPVPVPNTQWVEAGQRLTVQAQWPGGRAPVHVVLKASAGHFDPGVAPGSAELPQRSDAEVATVVNAPLGQWVTVAATVADQGDRHTVSSGQAAPAARRVLQLRISLLP